MTRPVSLPRMAEFKLSDDDLTHMQRAVELYRKAILRDEFFGPGGIEWCDVFSAEVVKAREMLK